MADPSTISGLVARYRASDITGLVDAASIPSWSDTSGSGYTATQGTAANQPTYRTAVVGGQPVVRFASPQALASNLPASLSAQTLIVVLRVTSGGVRTIRGSVNDGGLQFRVNSNLTPGFVKQNISDIGAGTVALTSNTSTVLTGTYDSASGVYQFYVNGGAGTGGTSVQTLSAGTTSAIGKHGTNSSENFVGDIAELLVWNRVLTTAERATVHSYAQDRYGITVADYQASGGTNYPTAGTATGAGAVSGFVTATAVSNGTASGTGTLSATATATLRSSGNTFGSGTVSAIAASSVAAVGTASGTGSVTGTAIGSTNTTGTATGTGSATASATSNTATTGSTSGNGTTTGSSAAALSTAGSASGLGTTSGMQGGGQYVGGAVTGTGTVTATASSSTTTTGTAIGNGTATGTATAAPSSAGTAIGTGSAIGTATASVTTAGTTAGRGTTYGTVTYQLRSDGAIGSTGTVTGSVVMSAVLAGSVVGKGQTAGTATSSNDLVRDIEPVLLSFVGSPVAVGVRGRTLTATLGG